jgi:hypothetical protein
MITQFEKNKKVGLNFLRQDVVGNPLLFFQTVQPTKIVMDIVYRLLIKSNDYTVHKKSRFNFFCGRRGVSRPLLFL